MTDARELALEILLKCVDDNDEYDLSKAINAIKAHDAALLEEAAERAAIFESAFMKNLDPKISNAYLRELRAAIKGTV